MEEKKDPFMDVFSIPPASSEEARDYFITQSIDFFKSYTLVSLPGPETFKSFFALNTLVELFWLNYIREHIGETPDPLELDYYVPDDQIHSIGGVEVLKKFDTYAETLSLDVIRKISEGSPKVFLFDSEIEITEDKLDLFTKTELTSYWNKAREFVIPTLKEEFKVWSIGMDEPSMQMYIQHKCLFLDFNSPKFKNTIGQELNYGISFSFGDGIITHIKTPKPIVEKDIVIKVVFEDGTTWDREEFTEYYKLYMKKLLKAADTEEK